MPLKACLLIKPLAVYSNETVDNFRSHKHRLELASCSCSPRWSSHPMIMSNSTHDASAILLIDFWPNIQPNLYLFADTGSPFEAIAVFRSVRNSHGQISVADLEQMTKHKRVLTLLAHIQFLPWKPNFFQSVTSKRCFFVLVVFRLCRQMTSYKEQLLPPSANFVFKTCRSHCCQGIAWISRHASCVSQNMICLEHFHINGQNVSLDLKNLLV